MLLNCCERDQRMQGVLGYLQGPRDAAVTLETAPVLEVPLVRSFRQELPDRLAATICKHDHASQSDKPLHV